MLTAVPVTDEDILAIAEVLNRGLEERQMDTISPDDVWAEDPMFPREDRRYEVNNNDTNLGYWAWVKERQVGWMACEGA